MANYVTRPAGGKFDAAKPPSYMGFIDNEASLSFNISGRFRGTPGIVNPDNILDKNRDYDFSYLHPTVGFAGVRWCPSWLRTDTQLGRWQPAGTDIYRIQRKGVSGVDLQTLLITCGPNSAAIPAGESVVIWDATDDVTVSAATTHNLSGYSLPLKSKITISACTPSVPYDVNGRRTIEIFVGSNLPAIDFSPTFFSGEGGIQKSTMQLRHWAFYANTATKQLRLPFRYFFDLTKRVVNSGAYSILGGNRWAPSTYDWSKDYLNFGDTLVRELFTKECQALSNEFGSLNPRRLAVELENRPVHPWADNNTIPGYRTLLNDVWYPIARSVWGQERTLIVKGSGTVNSILTNFDWKPPKGENTHFCVHMSDAGITNGGASVDFTTLASSDWLADQIRTKIDTLGFSGGGVTSVAVNAPQNTVEKAKRLGRVLTSFTNKNLYVWYNGHYNSDPDTTVNLADVFMIDGHRIEALYPEMRSCASRAGNIGV